MIPGESVVALLERVAFVTQVHLSKYLLAAGIGNQALVTFNDRVENTTLARMADTPNQILQGQNLWQSLRHQRQYQCVQ